MNIFKSSNFVSRSLIGTVGLSASAIALLGVPQVAEAASIWQGSDYLSTPGQGTTVFDFGGDIGEVSFKGLPIGPGNTDTIIQRQLDCMLEVGGSCDIPIEMTALSLVSEAPVDIDGLSFDVFVGLDPENRSTGLMTINHQNTDADPSQGTFSSILDVFFKTNFVEKGGTGANDFMAFDNVTMTVTNAPWSHTPAPDSVIVIGDPGIVKGDGTADQDASCHSQEPGCPVALDSENNLVGDFFPGVVGGMSTLLQHDASGAAKHGVVTAHKIPEPSMVLASIFGLGGMLGLKKKQESDS